MVAEGNDLWAAIVAQGRPHKVVPFPRKKPGTDEPIGEIAMVVLTVDEVTAAASAADRRAEKLFAKNNEKADKASSAYRDVYNNFACAETLYRACKLATDPSKPFFTVPDHITQYLHTDETAMLFQSYLHVQAELSPMYGDHELDVDAWLDRIERAGNLHPLDSCSWGVLISLVGSLVGRVRSLQNSRYSRSGAPDDSSDDSKTDTAIDPARSASE